MRNKFLPRPVPARAEEANAMTEEVDREGGEAEGEEEEEDEEF